MDENKILCNRCKQIRNEEVLMIEKRDTLVCPKCQTSLIIKERSPLERFKENWNNNADEIFAFVRPELNQGDLANPKLFFLYEDCYHTLLIGKYNASIVLMGVLLEALMKERINLKLGGYFDKPYGACLKKIEEEKLMRGEDIHFLKKFKNMIRNLYQHSDEAKILQGIFIPTWAFEFGDITLEKIEKAIEGSKSGQFKPKLLPASDIPALRTIAKQAYDTKIAIELFNQVYDFLIVANIRYFKQKEYEEHNKKFGTGLENVEHYKV